LHLRSTSPGDVVSSAEQFLIVVGHARDGTPIGLSIRPQTARRHRSQIALSPAECVALGLSNRASIIDTESVWPSRSPVVRGRCSSDLLKRIATTMRHCREADAFERAYAVEVPSCL
jgi:hypothetical protein